MTFSHFEMTLQWSTRVQFAREVRGNVHRAPRSDVISNYHSNERSRANSKMSLGESASRVNLHCQLDGPLLWVVTICRRRRIPGKSQSVATTKNSLSANVGRFPRRCHFVGTKARWLNGSSASFKRWKQLLPSRFGGPLIWLRSAGNQHGIRRNRIWFCP